MMQRIKGFLLPFAMFFGICALFLLALPLFFDGSKYKDDISAILSGALNADVLVKGDLDIVFFPNSKLELTEVEISIQSDDNNDARRSDTITIPFLIVDINILSTLSGSLSIRDMTLHRPSIVVYDKSVRLERGNWLSNLGSDGYRDFDIQQERKTDDQRGLLKYIIDYLEKGTGFSGVEKLSIKDGIVEVRNFEGDVKIFDFVNGYFELKKKEFLSNFNFSYQRNKISFNASALTNANGYDIETKVAFDGAVFHLGGILTDNETPGFEGNFSGEISNAASSLSLLLGDKSLSANYQSKSAIKISSAVNVENDIYRMERILLEGDDIEGFINVEAYYDTYQSGLVWDINSAIQNVNIDNLFSPVEKDVKTQEQNINYFTRTAEQKTEKSSGFDIPLNITIILDINIADMVYKNTSISNIVFLADHYNGRASIKKFQAELVGDSTFSLVGEISHNGIRPILKGNVKFSGRKFRSVLLWLDPDYRDIAETNMGNYFIGFDFEATPLHKSIPNFRFSMDGMVVSGNMDMRTGSGYPIIGGKVEIDNLNMDAYRITSIIYDQFDKTISGLRDISYDDVLLGRVNSKVQLDVVVRDSIFNQHDIDALSFDVDVIQGALKVSDFKIDSDLFKAASSFYVNLQNLLQGDKPAVIEWDLDVETLDWEFFDRASLDTKDSEETFDYVAFFKQPINFLSADKFRGKVDVRLDSFRYDYIDVDDLTLKTSLENKFFRIEALNFNMLGAGINVEGGLFLGGFLPSVQFTYILKGLDLQDLSRMTGISFSDSQGKLHMAGEYRSEGGTLLDIVKEQKSRLKVEIYESSFGGLDLSKVVRGAAELYSVLDVKNLVEYSSKTGRSDFESIEGVMNLKGFLLESDKIYLKNDHANGIMSLKVDLNNFLVKALSRFYFQPNIKKNKLVHLDVTFRGPLEGFDVKLDTTNINKYILEKSSASN